MSELPSKWLTVDIGETTGYATWERNLLIEAGEAELWTFVYATGFPLLTRAELGTKDLELRERLAGWELLVIEDWSLYADKALALVGDKQDTVRGLGALQFIADALDREYHLQGALIKPAAKAAGAEAFFSRPLYENRHSNDAIMHGFHYCAMQGEAAAQG